MLREAGFDVRCVPSDLDDADLSPRETPPSRWVMAMAWFKAARVRARLPKDVRDGVLIAADTVCDLDGQIVGKPADEVAAVRVIRSLVGRDHAVHTGVCAIDLTDGTQRLLVDTAVVSLGAIDAAAIDAYAATGAWRGKAGDYNYADALDQGWPLACNGDPTSVMGLPMRRLRELLPREGRSAGDASA